VIDALLTLLFKYPSRVWEQGELTFAPVVPWVLLLGLGLAGIVAILVAYRRVVSVAPRARYALAFVRVLTLLIVLVALLRPQLVVTSAVPQRNILAVLLDDSRSMRLTDLGEQTRLATVQESFGDSSAIVAALGEQFVLRFFRVAADARPVSGASALSGSGTRTDLATALDDAREELSGVPVAGMLVVSDGADNGGTDLGASLLALRARRIPVFTVGVGLARFPRDIAIERVGAPTTILEGATVLIDATLRLRGVGGETTTITVESDGRVVATEAVTLPERGDIARTRLRVPALTPGTHRLTVRAKVVDGETVTENNESHQVVLVRRGPERILYVEGEPRPEFSFLRRAVAPDSAVQVVGLLRSAEQKFLRLGVRDSLELIGGFPVTREELFQYRAIVLGSVEASFFRGDQLRMLADYVSRRGGSVLALGGRSALGEGGYAGTPLSEVLPVSLVNVDRDDTEMPTVLAVRPTSAGREHAALQLAPTPTAAAARWDSLPPLTSVNRLGPLRAGATVLLTGRDVNGGTEVNLLAFQRYGRGMGAVFGVQDTWLWQMDASITLEDETHETLWRQTLRWLVDGVPDQVEIVADPMRVGPGEPVTLQARVADSAFRALNDASVSALVTTPSGRLTEVPLEWTLREDGAYAGAFIADEAGVYSIIAEARRGRDTTRSRPGALLADDQGADVEQAELRTSLLQRVSDETGGRYYDLADADRVVRDASITAAGVTAREARDLWDMPIVLLVFLSVLATEWILRRREGLA
jgi:uncharacterized membrane protein